MDPNFNKVCFMAHGYQFEDWEKHHFVAAPWWNVFMGWKEETKRELNEFWHGWKADWEDIDYDSFYRYLKSQGIRMTSIKGGHIRKFIQIEIYEKNKRFYDNASNYLKNKGLNHITNVIFGHIHDPLQVRDGNLIITTNGCWLQNKQTYFTEIKTNGDHTYKEL